MQTLKQKNQLPNSYVSAFCMEISMLLKAGMPLDQGMLSMMEDEKTEDGKNFLKTIYDSLDDGSTFSDALKTAGGFSEYMVDMVHVAEQTGDIETVLHELYLYYKNEEALYRNVRSAVLYPMIMVGMMFVVLVVLVLKVLPMFNEVYYAMGSSVPPIALTIMKTGNFVCKAALLLFIIAIACFIASVIYEKSTGGRQLFHLKDRLLSHTKIAELIAVSRFTSVISMALSSGLDLEYALDLAKKLIKHTKTQDKISACKDMINKGESFSDSIEKTGIVRGTYAGLLSVGFKAGSSETVMKEVSERYSQEVENKIGSTVAAIEPTLVIVLSVLVGVILLLVMMPLMGIMSSI